jgi:hypothetical protein
MCRPPRSAILEVVRKEPRTVTYVERTASPEAPPAEENRAERYRGPGTVVAARDERRPVREASREALDEARALTVQAFDDLHRAIREAEQRYDALVREAEAFDARLEQAQRHIREHPVRGASRALTAA